MHLLAGCLRSTILLSAATLLAHALPRTTHLLGSDAATNKLVVAHHIIGYTYPYNLSTWESDIELAYRSGLDGFALNVGSDTWEADQVANAYQAAEKLGYNFKLFVSLDMSSFPCSSADNATILRQYVANYSSHPNQLRWDGGVFVSTFSGSDCTFGQNTSADGWKVEFIDKLMGDNSVHFVPSFFVDPSTFSDYDGVMDGDFNWNGGWPIDLNYASAASDLGLAALSLNFSIFLPPVELMLESNIGVFTTDTQCIAGLSMVNGTDKTYMGAVSPWFFTHYSPETYDKNWIYLADYWSYEQRWTTLIENRDVVDIVEIITWNDYSESHYVGPIEGAQPNSQGWTNGMPHLGWLAMTNYYATAFRTGTYPPITEDQIYMWARPHPKDAIAWNDTVGKPTSYELTEDKLWAVVFAQAPAIVEITTAPWVSQTAAVAPGVTRLSVDLVPGFGMSATMTRLGKIVVRVDPGLSFVFDPVPATYNYNAFVSYASGRSYRDA